MKPKLNLHAEIILIMSLLLGVRSQRQGRDATTTSNRCNTPPMPTNGQVSCVVIHISGINTQLLCTYTCDAGYKFKGVTDTSFSRLCSNGAFSAGTDPPQCVSVCSEPELPPFVKLTCDDDDGTSKRTCTASCQTTYKFEIEPQGNYVCHPGESWYPELSTIPKCLHTQETILNHGLSVCTTWGQDHYRTFDNSVYTFKGQCKYVLAYLPNTFTIMVVNDPRCISSVSCKRDIEIYFGDNAVALRSTHNGTVVLWNSKIFSVPGSRRGTVIEKVGNYITVRSSLKFNLKWDGSQSVFVKASDELKGKISGLCGRFNGNPSDDFENDKGNVVTSVASFATSWKKTELDDEVCADSVQTAGCPVNRPQQFSLVQLAESKCGDLTDSIFKQCHALVDPAPYIQACKADCCEQNSSECMCQTMEAYSRACMDQSLKLTWRRSDRCEIHCPGGMVYKECGSSCVPDCSNTDAVCSDPTCVDGCFCPDGWVLHKGNCIESSQCPCTRGSNEYDEGSLITEECNSCSCVSGKWNCTHKDCDAVCSVMGDPHYSTFDGRRYDFMGICSYYLVQTHDLSIVVDNIRCGSEASCTKSLGIDFKGLDIKLDHNHQLTVRGNDVVRLPYYTSAVQISMISSLFMQVVLSNGVTVLWDGHTRAYIKVPPSLKHQTQGLCGTYDDRQNNDYLTPQGSTETNINLFGNQWKTSKDCADVPLAISPPPCETQSQRKVQASQLCGQLKSSLFETCHDLEDVTEYYTDCMYDLCSCTENIQDCLCPSLATYADSCAAKGVKINWRLQVKECTLQCPGGQVYQVCGRPCEHTCYALAQNSDNLCDQKCVEGCSCPDAQSLNDEGECVSADKCPCIFDGREYPAGFTTLKGKDFCVCARAQWQCSKIRLDNENITRLQSLCPDNMEYSSCASSCPVTCENAESALTCPKDEDCSPGCVCKDGYVFDGNKCILSSMCPCYHGGKSYYDGDRFFIDCNECVCKNQKWECEMNDCPSTCSAYGDSHYTTFDGRRFEFQGSCDYVMAKSTTHNPDRFLITTTNLQCGTTGVTCSKGIEFITGVEGTSSFYKLQFIRGKDVKPESGSPFSVKEVGEMIYVTTPFGVTVQWDKGTRVYIRLSVQHIGKVEGLCGNFNGDQKDDFQTRSGGLPVARPTSFGDSWRVHSTCETSKEVVDTCVLAPHRKSWAQHRCSVIASDIFEPCHALVEPKEFIERCEFDACGCDMGGDCECLCTAIAAYAHECANKGMPIKWRSKDLCGLTCVDCEEYNPCISLCPKMTCDNSHNYSRISENCEDKNLCFEGCDLHPCPEGQVYDSLVEPVTCIPKPLCLAQSCDIGGKKYVEGERIDNPLVCRPECEICNCRHGEIEHISFGVCFTIATVYPPLSTAITTPTRPTITCIRTSWTGWMSASVPTYANVGDRESVTGLREKYTFCADYQITGIRCRVISQPEYGRYFGQKIICDLESGLICNHKDQTEGLCLDYEVSFNCDCSIKSPTTVTVTTTTSSTPSSSSLAHHPIPMCGWTQWMNSYKLTSQGDIESISNLRLAYPFCSYPTNIACRTVPDKLNQQGIRYDQARQMAVTCDLNRGLVCLNSAQSGGQSCYDYEVAVECKDGCDTVTVTNFTTPVTTVRKTALSSETSSPPLSTRGATTGGFISTTSTPSYQSKSTFVHTNHTVQSSAFASTASSEATKTEQTTLDHSTMISKDTSLTSGPSTTTVYQFTSVSDHTSSPTTLSLSSEYRTEKTTSRGVVTSLLATATTDHTTDISSPGYISCIPIKINEEACDMLGVFNTYVVGKDQIGASSSAEAAFDAHNGRLRNTASGPTNGGAWMPRSSDPNPYLVIDLEDLQAVAGVATQGRPDYPEWVTSYSVYISQDGVNFIPYCACDTDKPMVFLGNNDSNSIVKVFFDRTVFAKKIAIYPIEFVIAIAMRVDLLTCNGVATISLETQASTTPATTEHSSSPSEHTDLRSTEFSSSASSNSGSTSLSTKKSSVATTVNLLETTPGSMTTITKCNTSHWLLPINRNTDVITKGDREDLSTEELAELCHGGKVTKIKCYAGEIPASQTGDIVECDLVNGLTCSNIDNGHTCKDYSITYWCECQLMISTALFTTSSFTKTTVTTFGKNTSELYTKGTTNRSTASASTFSPTTSSTSVPASSSVSQTVPTRTTPSCETGWSQWINRNVPTHEHGEHEKMSREEKRQFCPGGRITAIECENDSGIKADSDPQSSCTLQNGLNCTNLEPIPGWDLPICYDYKVKYYCDCSDVPPTQQQQNVSTSPSQRVPVRCGWSPWLNADKPTTGASDYGDLETVEVLKNKFLLCPNIKDIECRVAGTATSAIDAGQMGVKCDILNGLRCYNLDTENGLCYDYEVRLFCWDDECTGSTTPLAVETTPTQSTYPVVTSTVVCLPGRVWDPCAHKCDEVCHFMGYVTGACSEQSLEGCVPGCKSVSPITSKCLEGQKLLDQNTCVDTMTCTCHKPDGSVARPFESWADPKNTCSRCSCFNNEVICSYGPECSGEHTLIPVTQSSLCAWSSWINDDKPDTGGGDTELISLIHHKYGLCAAPSAIECRIANTSQDVRLSGQHVTCTKKDGLLCLNANNGGRCRDYEIRVFCPCLTTTDYTSASGVLSSTFTTSSSSYVPPFTSLPTLRSSEESTKFLPISSSSYVPHSSSPAYTNSEPTLSTLSTSKGPPAKSLPTSSSSTLPPSTSLPTYSSSEHTSSRSTSSEGPSAKSLPTSSSSSPPPSTSLPTYSSSEHTSSRSTSSEGPSAKSLPTSSSSSPPPSTSLPTYSSSEHTSSRSTSSEGPSAKSLPTSSSSSPSPSTSLPTYRSSEHTSSRSTSSNSPPAKSLPTSSSSTLPPSTSLPTYSSSEHTSSRSTSSEGPSAKSLPTSSSSTLPPSTSLPTYSSSEHTSSRSTSSEGPSAKSLPTSSSSSPPPSTSLPTYRSSEHTSSRSTSSNSPPAKSLPTSSSSTLPPSTSLPTYSSSEHTSSRSTSSEGPSAKSLPTSSSSTLPPSTSLPTYSSSEHTPGTSTSSNGPPAKSSSTSSAVPPSTSLPTYRNSEPTSGTSTSDNPSSPKSSHPVTQSTFESSISTHPSDTFSTHVSPPQRSSGSTASDISSAQTSVFTGKTFTTPTNDISKMCGWTQWMSDHSLDDHGDMEAVSHLRSKYIFCDNSAILSMRCRDKVTKKTPEELGQSHVLCDPSFGLVCINSNSSFGQCADYEVSFLCDPIGSNCIIETTTVGSKETSTTQENVRTGLTTQASESTSSEIDTAQTTERVPQSTTSEIKVNSTHPTKQITGSASSTSGTSVISDSTVQNITTITPGTSVFTQKSTTVSLDTRSSTITNGTSPPDTTTDTRSSMITRRTSATDITVDIGSSTIASSTSATTADTRSSTITSKTTANTRSSAVTSGTSATEADTTADTRSSTITSGTATDTTADTRSSTITSKMTANTRSSSVTSGTSATEADTTANTRSSTITSGTATDTTADRSSTIVSETAADTTVTSGTSPDKPTPVKFILTTTMPASSKVNTEWFSTTHVASNTSDVITPVTEIITTLSGTSHGTKTGTTKTTTNDIPRVSITLSSITTSDIPHSSSTLSQSLSTSKFHNTTGHIYESTTNSLLQTSRGNVHSTAGGTSKTYPYWTSSSSYTSTQSINNATTPGVIFTHSTKPKVCVNLLTDAEPLYVLGSRLTASSSLSQYTGPERSRIDSKADGLYTGAWIPLYNSKKQWIKVTFNNPVIVTGITIQGRNGVPEWIKTFTALYSLDGIKFYSLVTADEKSTVFTGNSDSATKHTEWIEPAEVTVVIIQPETWEQRVALRFELLGCLSSTTFTKSYSEPHTVTTPPPAISTQCIPESCEHNMGLKDRRIRDDMITASSFRDATHVPSNARLGGTRSWVPSASDISPYIQINLMTPQLISGITTQGRPDAPLFVRTYKINYSSDGSIWNPYREVRGQDKIFYSNWDSATPVRQLFQRMIQTQYIRIFPLSWNNEIGFRFEIHGCLNVSYTLSYPNNPTTSTSVTTTTVTIAYLGSTKIYKSAAAAEDTDCTEWDQWLDLNHPNLTNRDEIEPINALIANSLHCKNPMAIDCRPVFLNRQQTNSPNVSCNLYEGFKCLVSDGNEPICNNYKVRLGCFKETPECMPQLTNRSPVPVCYAGLDILHCPETCQQGFFCNGTKCVPKSACPCSLNDKIILPDGVARNENCEICQCLNGETICAPTTKCTPCEKGVAYRNTSSCDCQCLTCKPEEFQCEDGSCIPGERRCNCIIDCTDDEFDCDIIVTYTPSAISKQTTEPYTTISTTVSHLETSSPTIEVTRKIQQCSYMHASKIENGSTVSLSLLQEKVYQIGERWSDGLCKSCVCTNGTGETSMVICTEQECTLCKPGEIRVQKAGSCCGKCKKIASGCVFGRQLYKAGDTLPSSKKCYITTCEKSIFEEDFMIHEKQIPCVSIDTLPFCQPELNETERYDNAGCCLKCNPKFPGDSICSTCSPQLVAGNQTETIGYFKVTLETGVTCQNMDPIPDLKRCGGYCSSTSSYADVLKGFQSSCSCCQPSRTTKLSIQLHCSDGQFTTKDYSVPETCACKACSGGI